MYGKNNFWKQKGRLDEMRYKIYYTTFQEKLLIFEVSEYKISDGNFVEFVDEKTNERKKFPSSRCEIQEVIR